MTADRAQSFMAILLTDVSLAIERNEHAATQATRRDLMRVGFAALEGVAWIYRECVVEWAGLLDQLSPAEAGALAEVVYNVSEHGQISDQRRYLSLVPMIRLTARIAKRLDPSIELDFSSVHWAQLRRAITTRNRVTHPKCLADMVIAAAEAEECIAGFFWFLEQTARTMEASNTALRDYIGGMSEILQQLEAGDPQTLLEYAEVVRLMQDN